MITRRLTHWILLCTLGFVSCEILLNLNDPCKFKQYNGTCQHLYSCKMAMEIVKIRDFQTIRSMFCGFDQTIPMVCCPKADKSDEKTTTTKYAWSTTVAYRDELYIQSDIEVVTTSTPPPPPPVTAPPKALSKPPSKARGDLFNVLPGTDVCGLVTDEDRIFGGQAANIDDFPWLARIKYYNPIRGVELYGCAGSLISDRYILTAAHCIGTHKIVNVRLGEYDTESDIDCQDDVCNDPPVDVKIDKISVYPGFSRKNILEGGDIALLRLEKPVNFTDFVRPVCLPTSKYVAKQDYIDSTYTTAGWGKTEFGQEAVLKQKLTLNSIDYPTCRITIENLPDIKPPTVICAGTRKGQDTCNGDSGGPLARVVGENYKENWYIFGVTSFGLAKCGTEGRPGIYTRVSSYMDWILQTMNESR